MFGIGLMELLTILVLATLVMGPEGMVKFAGQLGQWLAKFRRETEGVTREFKEAFNLELNPKEFTDALDVGLDPRDPLGLKQTASTPAAKAAPATTRQWNLPTSASTPASAATQAAIAASTVAGALDTGESLESEASMTTEAELPSPVEALVVDTSPDAEAVMVGVAEWVPDDDRAEATVIGEPLWVDVADETPVPEMVAGARAETANDQEEQGKPHVEEEA